jgi:thiosulfate dehydrogenase
MSRFLWFLLGMVVTIGVLFGGGYLFLAWGGVNMQTNAAPLPLERTVAEMAMHASYGSAAQQKSPLPMNEANLLAGAETYRKGCAGCHGLSGSPSRLARAMFPNPPQLLEKDEMVTDDPEGVTYGKVTHGIRLSGMPAFGDILPENARWQVTLLLAHADQLPQSVQAALKR